jgi:hypothetical protein
MAQGAEGGGVKKDMPKGFEWDFGSTTYDAVEAIVANEWRQRIAEAAGDGPGMVALEKVNQTIVWNILRDTLLSKERMFQAYPRGDYEPQLSGPLVCHFDFFEGVGFNFDLENEIVNSSLFIDPVGRTRIAKALHELADKIMELPRPDRPAIKSVDSSLNR